LKRLTQRFTRIVMTFLLGTVLTGLGSYANTFVMKHNHGAMPVWCFDDTCIEEVAADPQHTLLTKDSKYPILADIFPTYITIPQGVILSGIMSIGDVAIFAGQVIVWYTEIFLLLLPLTLLWDLFRVIRRI